MRERNQQISAAYLTAALMRWDSKKKSYPKLDSLLVQAGPKPEPTVDELWQRNLAVIRAQQKKN